MCENRKQLPLGSSSLTLKSKVKTFICFAFIYLVGQRFCLAVHSFILINVCTQINSLISLILSHLVIQLLTILQIVLLAKKSLKNLPKVNAFIWETNKINFLLVILLVILVINDHYDCVIIMRLKG